MNGIVEIIWTIGSFISLLSLLATVAIYYRQKKGDKRMLELTEKEAYQTRLIENHLETVTGFIKNGRNQMPDGDIPISKG